MQVRLEDVIPSQASVQKEHQETIDTKIYPEVHLLAGKLVPVVMTHSLGGSCANRHHTHSPTLGRRKNHNMMRVHKS